MGGAGREAGERSGGRDDLGGTPSGWETQAPGPGAEGEGEGPCLPTSPPRRPGRYSRSCRTGGPEPGPTFLGSAPRGARAPLPPSFLARPFNPAKESRWKKSCAKAKSAFHSKFPRNQTYDYILPPTYLEPLSRGPGCGSGGGSAGAAGGGCGSPGRPGARLPGACHPRRVSRINQNFPETEICVAQSLSGR